MPERPDSYERMPFLKLYSREWLQGSLRVQNDAAERGVFADFLAMANESRNRGVIQANNETPYPYPYLAAVLNIPLELLEHCIFKFTEQDRIAENDQGIEVLNFGYWQGLDTRRRGRPSKRSRERHEQTAEQKLTSEYHNRLAIAKIDKKQELGRPLTSEEIRGLMAKVQREVYGESDLEGEK